MKIFKFGGASIKDAESVKNVANIIRTEVAKDTLVVISAMGKMTNAFEDVVEAYYNKTENLPKKLNFIEDFHKNIMNSLFDKDKDSKSIANLLKRSPKKLISPMN